MNKKDLLNIKEIVRETFIELITDHKEEIKLALSEQERNITRIISANTKIINDQMEKMEKRMCSLAENHERLNRFYDEVKKEHEEFKDSLDFINAKTEETVVNLRSELNNIHEENDYLRDSLRIQEDRSRRNNVRFDGITEETGETWAQAEQKVLKVLREKMDIEGAEIERAHRVGKVKNGKPRTIVAKFLRYKDKEMVLANWKGLKGTRIYVKEDFSADTLQLRSKLWTEVLNLRRQGKYAILKYDKIYQRNFRNEQPAASNSMNEISDRSSDQP